MMGSTTSGGEHCSARDDSRRTPRDFAAMPASPTYGGLGTARSVRPASPVQEAILDSLLDAVVTIDRAGTIESANAAVEHMFGYSAAELVGRNVRMLMPSPYREEHDRYLSRYLATGERKVIGIGREAVAQRRDGSIFPVELSVLQIVRDGRLTFAGVIRDISDRKEVERQVRRYTWRLEQSHWELVEQAQQLRLAQQRADEASHAKSQFLANMSHEMRTPLTAILGYCEMLQPLAAGERQQEILRGIQRSGECLLGLINNVLDLSRIESGALTIEAVRWSPCQLVSDVASSMRLAAAAKGLQFRVEYEGPIPAQIVTDPLRLRQILLSLVGNAVKFTERGQVRLRTRLVGDPAKQLEFRVIDTGSGIDTEHFEYIFQPFTQADESMSRLFGGTGLGLPISRSLAAALGGTLQVESTLGQGSQFILRVPTGPLDGIELLDRPSESALPQPSPPPRASGDVLAGCRVLVAEDAPDSRRVIEHVLERAGARATLVENGALAVDAARQAEQAAEPFDVILMDMQMPELDGYQATARLRELGYGRPIVALTAHALVGDRERCLAAGCDEYLSKPVCRQALVEMVARFARREAPSAAGPAQLQ